MSSVLRFSRRLPSVAGFRSRRSLWPTSARTFASSPELEKTDTAHGALWLASLKLKKVFWNTYIATGRGSIDIFNLIDADADHFITPAELKEFLESVQLKGVNPKAIEKLDTLNEDEKMDVEEFKSWLIPATKFSFAGTNNVRMKTSYESHPHIGERAAPEEPKYTWNMTTMSQSVRRMQYAVRGEVVMRADALKAEGKDILFTNVGNPHGVGQKALTYYRQVLSLCDLPGEFGVDNPDIVKIFPKDVVERAKEIRAGMPSGTGAYTHSQGNLLFRKDIADFVAKRDGHPSYPGNIFMTNGASSAIDMVLTCLIADNKDAIMIPIPQYPIYSALIGRLGARQVGYELDEDLGWAVTREELESKVMDAKGKDLHVRALALINPGNPTGQVLTRNDLEVVLKFCAENGIVLLADEVYQRNVYVDDKPFFSAKKVAKETPGCENLQLVSFHSTSKGFIGECGRRGGYMELHGIDPYVQAQLYKLASSGLCSGVAGQVMTSLMVRPPQPGEESYARFNAEENEIYDSLKRRAKALVDGLNGIDGIDCVRAEGAMYAFPRITLPSKAIEKAEAENQTPDTLYALSLLEETGICVVPASGFGQKAGRIGFRTTFLPPEDKLMEAIDKFSKHHEAFCTKYA